MPVASEEEGPAMTEKAGEDGLKAPRTVSHPRAVRRCLFGEVDHEANRREAIRIREDLSMASKRKWNFDFENGCPLEGQYLWASVEQGSHPSHAPSTPGSRNVAPSLTLADCPPSGEALVVGCVNFDLGVVPLESSLSSDSATGTRRRISDSEGDSREHLATITHRRQPTLRKYFRVKKRSAQKLEISK